MSHELLSALMLFIVFLVLFAVAELLHQKGGMPASRAELVAFYGTGIITLLFPLLFTSIWIVLFLCINFGMIQYIIIRGKLLPCFENTQRDPAGILFYTTAVFICFFIYQLNHNLLCFYLPVVTFAVGEPVASHIGERWPVGIFMIRYKRKTVSGAIAFFIASVLITGWIMMGFSDWPSDVVYRKALLMGVIASLAETISIRGFENLAVPLSILLGLRMQV